MLPELDFRGRLDRVTADKNYLKQHVRELGWAWHHVLAQCGILDTFVEVGAMGGASFYIYSGLLKRGGKAIAIDDGKRGWRTRRYLRNVISRLQQHEEIDARLIRGNSHEIQTRDQLCDILDGRKIDLLHIDGDHSAAGSFKDWEDYGSLVRPGGVIAMHDIRATSPCHVEETWRRICNAGYLTRTLCKGKFRVTPEGKTHKECGIGLIYV